jgi:hypothetical protein
LSRGDEGDDSHIAQLSKSDVVLTFQIEVSFPVPTLAFQIEVSQDSKSLRVQPPYICYITAGAGFNPCSDCRVGIHRSNFADFILDLCYC